MYTTKEQVAAVIKQLEIFSSLGLEINEFFLNSDKISPADFPDKTDASYINWLDNEK